MPASDADIGWWDATWNPFGGCCLMGPGCLNCYAAKLAGTRNKREPLCAGTTTFKNGRHIFNGKMTVLPPDHPYWLFPLTWPGRECPLLGPGQPSLLWAGSMSDLFADQRPQEVIDRVVGTLVYSKHIGLLLNRGTKRKAEYFTATPPSLLRQRKLWLGFSAENQEWFDRRWQHMRPLAVAGWTVFVSVAPMLGPVVLPPDFLELGAWCICSAERAGKHTRPIDWAWVRALRDRCSAASVPFFLLSAGTVVPQHLESWEFPHAHETLPSLCNYPTESPVTSEALV